MATGCGDVLSLEDLKTAKLHQIFEAEVITGKTGGLPGGADIDFATNHVTGQTQKTLPAVLRDSGYTPAEFNFTTGGTLNVGDEAKVVLWPGPSGDGSYYSWRGAYPKTIPANSTPASSGGVSATGWVPVTDAALREELASEEGATLSLAQVAAAYGLDFSLGGVWRAGQPSTPENWWLYHNVVYKSFGGIALPAAPDFTNFYKLRADGSYSASSFGMDTAVTDSAKLAKIASVLVASRGSLRFNRDVTINLSTDFVWSFNYQISDGVTVTVNSDSTSAREIRIDRSNFTLFGLTLGAAVGVTVTTESAKLKNITIRDNVFTEGGVKCVGSNRGYGINITRNSFLNNAGAVVNGIQVSDWCDVSISNNTGGRFTNAFILINPAYSYTCFNVDIYSNRAQQLAFGVALAGAAEIGCVTNFQIRGNVLSCPAAAAARATRAIVLQNASGGVIDGNTLSAQIHTAADGSNDIKFINNSVNFSGSVGLRIRGGAGWTIKNNTSHTNSSSVYHVDFSSSTVIPDRGIGGRSYFGGNSYFGGSRGVVLSSGIYYAVGEESFTSPTADMSAGVVTIQSTTFGSTIEGDQRSIKPNGNPVISNLSANSVVDGPAGHTSVGSTITPVVNGTVVSALHGKTYHFTVDLNNNIENFQSTIIPGQGKVVSQWASTVSGARLAINSSPFLVAAGDYRVQDSFVNGSPTPYIDRSNLTGVYAGCVIHKNGTMRVRYWPRAQGDMSRLLEPQMGDYIWQSAFFNIPLIINGVVSSYEHDLSAAPRTAIGQTAAGLLHIVVVDGRNADSAGCSTVEIANYLLAQGCVTAFNLDGGGSSTIWYNGNVINVPSDGAQRVVAQAWVFK